MSESESGASKGLTAAYGPRNRRAAQARGLAFRTIGVLGTRRLGDGADYIEFYPAARSAKEFADLSARVCCYLGDVDSPLYISGERFELDPTLVPYMDPTLVKDPGWVRDRPDGAPFLVVHRTTPASIAKVLTHGRPGSAIVDTEFYMTTEMNYWDVRKKVAWQNFPSAESSLTKLKDRFAGADSSFVLTTGPSSKSVDLSAVNADVRITCNSAVQDQDLLEGFRPNVIAFADPVFHFGPSRYAAKFREDLMNVVHEYDPILISTDSFVSPLLNMHPELESRLAVIPSRRGGPWRWPTKRNPTARAASSVLTNLILPTALMLADRVGVAGADGRQPGENYFWKHGTQYSDYLMQSVFDAHPAFFRDRDYADYYEGYCEEVEGLAAAAESAGKEVVAEAPSWIPALQKRGACAPVA